MSTESVVIKEKEGADVDQTSVKCFIVGLGEYMNANNIPRSVIVENGVYSDASTVSNLFNHKIKNPRRETVQKLAEIVGKNVNDLVRIGQEVLSRQESERRSNMTLLVDDIPVTPTNFVDPDNVVSAAQRLSSAVQTLAVQCRRDAERKDWWQELFDMLPTPALVVRDNVVIHQNRASTAIGSSTGATLCKTCAVDDCNEEQCAMLKAIETGVESDGECKIGGVSVKITAKPFRHGGREYVLVIGHK